MTLIRPLSIALTLLVLNACGSISQDTAPRVAVATDTFVQLPHPNTLRADLVASQLIIATWKDQVHQLPVQLEIKDNQLTLAGFSSWGMRLFSAQYTNSKITTELIAGLPEALPQPEQVVFNIMLAIYPLSVWQDRFSAIGWKIKQTDTHRYIIDPNDETIIDISYLTKKPFSSDITFNHLKLNYKIIIKTNNYSYTPLKSR